MIWKFSKDTWKLTYGLGALITLGAILLLVSPIWPELKLYRSGILCIGFGVTLAFFAFLAIQVDKAEDRKRNKTPRKMHDRFQALKK